MNKLAKTAITVGAVIIFFIISILATAGIKETGNSPTFVNVILFAGLIGALKAIWKKPKENNKKDDNTSILQK